MSDETKVDIEELFDRLRTLADPSRSVTRSEGYRTACDAIDCIRRLRAEVERWKPRDMTLQDVVDMFNKHMIHDWDGWQTDGNIVYCHGGHDWFDPGDATMIAQGLERDAAKGGA